jgi:hypothetical protein
MKLRHLFTANLFLAVFFGIACVLFPAWALGVYGAKVSLSAIWMTRMAGGSILGFGTLMWFGRRSESAEARKAIALALCVQDLVGLLACLEIQWRGGANALGWSNPVLYGLLALAYAWFLLVRPETS